MYQPSRDNARGGRPYPQPSSRRYYDTPGSSESASLLSSAASPGFAPISPAASARNRFSHTSSIGSLDARYPSSPMAAPSHTSQTFVPMAQSGALVATPYNPALVSSMREPDDALHEPDPPGYKDKRSSASFRGLCNLISLLTVVGGIIILFAGYPIANFVITNPYRLAMGNNVFVNGTGQAPVLATIPSIIDKRTPDAAKTRTGWDGHQYKLVFSDEFETNNRTFYPGDDPFWEAVDLWYGSTLDEEWYDPGQVTTADGFLRIKMEHVDDPSTNHNLSIKSGMLQSWNKFCFSQGYIEVRLQLPGNPTTKGFWPGAWLLGNLGRAGYLASNEGLWPYTYDSCDTGTYPNQTHPDKLGPPAALTVGEARGRPQYNNELSWLPGQRLSACTCANEDHPGPVVDSGSGKRYRGRGAPEIDIIEAEQCKHRGPDAHGCASQSAQFAPFSHDYEYDVPSVQLLSPDRTEMNDYHGSGVQQAVSALTNVSDSTYGGPQGGQSFGIFGFEYFSDPNDPANSFITWISDGQPSYTMKGTAVGPDPLTEIGQRLVPMEPMSIILNLGASQTFQTFDDATLYAMMPAELLIDYVRVYQRADAPDSAVGCDPPDYPTLDYINAHLNAYTNPQLTTWARAGYSFPRNSGLQACS
ncbi:beta-glucan synthesis-associated [Auricularia subglabra TFB-10046 SS5]|nr:beta-glucan synthesis-associated [Auricularia subglabra TFB-10046 SS5]